MIEQFGMMAGTVWQTLNEYGKMNLKQLKKLTKIRTEKELYAALGWLAKEGKLHFETDPEDEKGFLVSLLY